MPFPADATFWKNTRRDIWTRELGFERFYHYRVLYIYTEVLKKKYNVVLPVFKTQMNAYEAHMNSNSCSLLAIIYTVSLKLH
jgi:hypothetical protein